MRTWITVLLGMAIVAGCLVPSRAGVGYYPDTRFWRVHQLEGSLIYGMHSNDDIASMSSSSTSTMRVSIPSGLSSLGLGVSYWYGWWESTTIGGGVEYIMKSYQTQTTASTWESTSETNASIIHTFLGARMHFLDLRKLQPYVAGHAGYMFLGETKRSYKFTDLDDGEVSTGSLTVTSPGGFSFGVGVGSEYILSPALSGLLEMGIRYARISPLNYVFEGKTSEIKDGYYDLGGIYIKAGLSFMFGGLSSSDVLRLETGEGQTEDWMADRAIEQEMKEEMKDDEAIDFDSIKGKPGLKEFYVGLYFFQREKYKRAVYKFEQSVDLDPENTRSWLYLGEANLKLEELEAALAAFDEYLNLVPDNDKMKQWVFDQKQKILENLNK